MSSVPRPNTNPLASSSIYLLFVYRHSVMELCQTQQRWKKQCMLIHWQAIVTILLDYDYYKCPGMAAWAKAAKVCPSLINDLTFQGWLQEQRQLKPAQVSLINDLTVQGWLQEQRQLKFAQVSLINDLTFQGWLQEQRQLKSAQVSLINDLTVQGWLQEQRRLKSALVWLMIWLSSDGCKSKGS